ncbi:Heat shock 70 kDa protein 17-like [Forsythia ovata]|uniref:Heat shock 70 kDa protein 17-like n=1 Tax=Forsythia ovata TaxID=205694 RepID=A0ABD1QQ19_9LAMI
MSKLISSLSPTPSGWSVTTHFCSWTGIKCDNTNSFVTSATPLSLLQLDARDLYSKSSPINGSNKNVHSPRPNNHIRWAHRNSEDTLFQLEIFLSLFLLNTVQSQLAVASIDLGSKCLKVTVVNLKPGQAPISITINEMSKRKTPSLVAFHSNSRLIGEESLGLLGRYPTKKFLRSLYLSYDITPDKTRDVAVYKTEEDEGEFSKLIAEEMVAMILKYAMGLVENHAMSSVKDVVITVPPTWEWLRRGGC